MVLSSYDYTVYDSLGEVEDISKLVKTEDIRDVGKILLDFNYEQDVSIAIAHRHFDLKASEVMLETHSDDCRIAKPVDYISLSSAEDVYPNDIACNKDGIWHPVGYGT
uniref:Uncharacterized protein n=1 Tax=Panagrolaimus davidi TaxID=227884 RepID=A0A914Q5I4_9BILA